LVRASTFKIALFKSKLIFIMMQQFFHLQHYHVHSIGTDF